MLKVLDRARDDKSSKHQISVDRPLQKERAGLVNAKQVVEKKEETERTPKKQAPVEDWNVILKELKLHYMRTRHGFMVESFLYGSNIQFYFDYRGLPSKITDRTFVDTFSNMKFDDVLQFVSFPDVEVKFTGRHETKRSGKERRDM
ncbi:hypothetical protein ACHAO7_012355, partial [Fusarium culmorum]